MFNTVAFKGGAVSLAFSLSHDQQSQERNNIEHQKLDFEQPEKRVDDYVERLATNWKPLSLRTVHQIRDKETHDRPEDKESSVDDGAPHEECGQHLKVHIVFSSRIGTLINGYTETVATNYCMP
jgi:hypothetical protein